ncbi:MAG: AAA family ATPase [Sulfurimonas sp.]|nr:AAA family ATPase [Sulfurimonas sp.]
MKVSIHTSSKGAFRVRDENIYFDSASEAQEYAKKNIESIIVRNSDEVASAQVKTKKYRLEITPQSIYEYLNAYIIAQEEAKQEIALAMYYHSLSTAYDNRVKDNGPVMIVGPTGSGKTFIVQKACEYMDTLFIHVDTASMVPEGIVGYTIAHLAKDILQLADNNMKRARSCVVFFDEMDKLFINNESDDIGKQVASQLLRLIEGSKIKLSYSYNEKSADKPTELDTTNMQFILGGAFQWILDEKSKNGSTAGFANKEKSDENATVDISLEDLYKEDIPKELLGRMNTIVNLHKLSEEDYYKILTQSKSSPLKEFVEKIEFHGDRVAISDDTLHEIAKMLLVVNLE